MTATNYSEQKSIARILDVAAARCESIDAEPATSKQCWYLAHLILEAGEDADDWMLETNRCLTKRAASDLIDSYLH